MCTLNFDNHKIHKRLTKANTHLASLPFSEGFRFRQFLESLQCTVFSKSLHEIQITFKRLKTIWINNSKSVSSIGTVSTWCKNVRRGYLNRTGLFFITYFVHDSLNHFYSGSASNYPRVELQKNFDHSRFVNIKTL